MGGAFPENSPIVALFPIIKYIYSLMISRDKDISKKEHKKTICVDINMGLEFDLTEKDKNEMVTIGYQEGLRFIKDNHL